MDDELFYVYEYDRDVFTVYNYIDNDAIVVLIISSQRM
jgi:hypothetical protein